MQDSLRLPRDTGHGVYGLIYETHLRWVGAYRRNAGIIAQIYFQASTDPFMRELRLQLREGFIGPGARGLARLQQDGGAAADIDPRLTLEIIAGTGDELCFQRFVLGRELTDERTLVRLLTRLWFRAVGVDLEVIIEGEKNNSTGRWSADGIPRRTASGRCGMPRPAAEQQGQLAALHLFLTLVADVEGDLHDPSVPGPGACQPGDGEQLRVHGVARREPAGGRPSGFPAWRSPTRPRSRVG